MDAPHHASGSTGEDALSMRVMQHVGRQLHPKFLSILRNSDASTVLRRLGVVPLDGHAFVARYVMTQLVLPKSGKSTELYVSWRSDIILFRCSCRHTDRFACVCCEA